MINLRTHNFPFALCAALWFLLSPYSLRSQGVTGFYPLEIGDYWEYLEYGWMGELQDTTSFSVNRDTMIAGQSYRVTTVTSFRYNTSSLLFQRIDQFGNVKRLTADTTQEQIYFRLSDTSKTFWPQDVFLARFDVFKMTTILATSVSVFEVHHYQPYDSSEVIFVQEIAENLGLVRESYDELQGMALRGARIGGVVYGTITSVPRYSNAQPWDFALNQNYPNPFNGNTTISFSLAQASDVIIQVFNVLGERVEVLVDEHRAAGWHTITWNSGDLPSGVYICRLGAQAGSLARKLVILK